MLDSSISVSDENQSYAHPHDRALLPKGSDNSSLKFKPPYFNPDIHSKIIERARKENLIHEISALDHLQKSSRTDRSERSSRVDHLGKAGKIVSDLIKKHGLAKQKINKLKEEVSKQHQKQCFFKPQNISGEKYIFKGNIIQRNQIWLEQKKRKQIERKQQALVNDLQHCTFSPSISSRKVSQIYLKNKSKALNCDHSHLKQIKGPPQTPSPIKNKKDISLTQFETAKKEIKSRLFTIALRN